MFGSCKICEFMSRKFCHQSSYISVPMNSVFTNLLQKYLGGDIYSIIREFSWPKTTGSCQDKCVMKNYKKISITS